MRAEVLDRESMRRQLDGVQVVYHLAAHSTLDQHNDRAWRGNTDGVENVARAALAAGVRRFVRCSPPPTPLPRCWSSWPTADGLGPGSLAAHLGRCA